MVAVLLRRATAAAAASCVDQGGLVGLFGLMNVTLGNFLNPDGPDAIGGSSLVNCRNWGKYFLQPNGHEAQEMRIALRELGEDAVTCDSSLFDLCVGRNPGNSSGCQVLENVTVRSGFCHGTCAVIDGGVDCPAQNPNVQSALVEVMDTLGYAEENRTGRDACRWSGIYCSSDGGVEVSMPNYNLTGTLGSSLGKLALWLTRLVLRDNKLQGEVASELSQCTRLRHLQLQNNMLIGEVPNLGAMSDLQEVHLQNNMFSGQMPEDMFRNTSQLRLVNISRNSIEGTVPDLETARALNTFDGSRNLLSGLGKLPRELVQVGSNGRPELRQFALDLSLNAFVGAVPEQLLDACALTEVSMAGNGLTQLPIRGYWSDVAELRDRFTHQAIESKAAYTCPVGQYPDRNPPCWPVLRVLDFSGSHFNAPFQQFYAMLAQATHLQEVACEDCMLQGPVPEAVPMQYAFKASGSTWSEGCKPVEVHQFLEKFNVQNNPDLGCKVVEVQKTGQRVRCLPCPQYMEPPENASLPLQEQSECRCMASLQRYDTNVLEDACGCDQGMFLNQREQQCQACRAGRQDCEWQSARESKSPPRILPGNWAPELVEGQTFSHHSLVRCQKASCPQEEGGQCAPGRDPEVPGCGECLPGNYGREGECQPCEDGGQMRYVTIGLGLLVITLCMIPLMRGLVYREAARVVVDRLPEEEVLSLQTFLSCGEGIHMIWMALGIFVLFVLSVANIVYGWGYTFWLTQTSFILTGDSERFSTYFLASAEYLADLAVDTGSAEKWSKDVWVEMFFQVQIWLCVVAIFFLFLATLTTISHYLHNHPWSGKKAKRTRFPTSMAQWARLAITLDNLTYFLWFWTAFFWVFFNYYGIWGRRLYNFEAAGIVLVTYLLQVLGRSLVITSASRFTTEMGNAASEVEVFFLSLTNVWRTAQLFYITAPLTTYSIIMGISDFARNRTLNADISYWTGGDRGAVSKSIAQWRLYNFVPTGIVLFTYLLQVLGWSLVITSVTRFTTEMGNAASEVDMCHPKHSGCDIGRDVHEARIDFVGTLHTMIFIFLCLGVLAGLAWVRCLLYHQPNCVEGGANEEQWRFCSGNISAWWQPLAKFAGVQVIASWAFAFLYLLFLTMRLSDGSRSQGFLEMLNNEKVVKEIASVRQSKESTAEGTSGNTSMTNQASKSASWVPETTQAQQALASQTPIAAEGVLHQEQKTTTSAEVGETCVEKQEPSQGRRTSPACVENMVKVQDRPSKVKKMRKCVSPAGTSRRQDAGHLELHQIWYCSTYKSVCELLRFSRNASMSIKKAIRAAKIYVANHPGSIAVDWEFPPEPEFHQWSPECYLAVFNNSKLKWVFFNDSGVTSSYNVPLPRPRGAQAEFR